MLKVWDLTTGLHLFCFFKKLHSYVLKLVTGFDCFSNEKFTQVILVKYIHNTN